MPYIEQKRRNPGEYPKTPGELNFAITHIVQQYMHHVEGGLSYTNINAVIGVLQCATFELYRRVAIPYEDKKCRENGDAYSAYLTGQVQAFVPVTRPKSAPLVHVADPERVWDETESAPVAPM